MKKLSFLLVVIFLFCFTVINKVDARSGCCSHHGGVCGCGCCDDSSLSATCAPYYPSCSNDKSAQDSDSNNSWVWIIVIFLMWGAFYWLSKRDRK